MFLMVGFFGWQVVLATLADLTGSNEWVCTNVGGGRRANPSHDGDFVVSHPSR